MFNSGEKKTSKSNSSESEEVKLESPISVREPKEEEEEADEEEEEEEDENHYEIDGFVVADDDVEEVEEEAQYQKIKIKKPKKNRKRLKKKTENESSAEEDRNLIEENFGRVSSSEPSKYHKAADDSDNIEESDEGLSDHERNAGPNYSEYHTIAKIFAYEQLPQPVLPENEPEFEPAEKKERFKTPEYEIIKSIDIPERLQHRLKYRENPSQEEIVGETEWMFTRCLIEKNLVPTESLKIMIARFLTMYRVEKYEIPFIHMYRMHLLSPDLLHEQLWELERWDIDWGFVYENKVKFRANLMKAAENAVEIEKGGLIEEEIQVLRSYDGVGYVPMQVWELINNSYSIDYLNEVQDLQHFLSAYIDIFPMKKTSDPIRLALNNRIPEFLQKSGINPLQFSENLKNRELVHKPGISHISPEDAAFDLLCDIYKDEAKVISIAQLLARKEISSLPWVRRFVREEYRKYAKLVTAPTEAGKTALDIYHSQYRVKNLTGMSLEKITPEIWADVWKAENSGWIVSEFQFSWKIQKDDKILNLLQPLYLSAEESDIDIQWNQFRLEILKQALEDMYKDFSKEIYNEFCSKAEDYIINKCKASYYKIIAKSPLLLEDESEKVKIIIIVTDPLVEFFGQTVLVVLDSNGAIVEFNYFRTIAARSFEMLSKTDQIIYRNEKMEIEKFIINHRPHSVIIAANCLHSLHIRKYIDGIVRNLNINRFNEKQVDWKIDQNQLLHHQVRILIHDIEVAKIFAGSQKAKSMLPEGDALLKTAVSLGRYVQMPLIETLGLWSDPNETLTLFLALDPLQKLVSPARLEWQLENVACEEVSRVGVDINRIMNHNHMQAILSFVPGLGPAKAYYLIESIYKKFKGKLKMRAALISKRLISGKVYENLAGFLYIKYEEKETEPLDSTRIHPASYEMAQKIAKSALEYPDDNKEEENITKIMRDPNQMKMLDLQIYANQLEQTQGRENMIKVLDFIIKELTEPFHTERKRFEEPSGLEILYLVSGESQLTLSRGKLVQCTIISYDDRNQSLVVKLESGLKGFIEKTHICEGRDPTKEEMKSFNKGLSLTARVLEVSGKIGESDIFFRIKLSLLQQDLTEHKRFLDMHLDPSFKEIPEDWNDKAGLEDDEYRQGQKYVPRIVSHPKFKNVGLKTSCEELENKDIGDCIFRPSSRGQDHLTCTWKFYTGVYAHLDIIEEGKPALNMLGTRFKIGTEVYESLQEIIDRYIGPCEKLTKEAVSSPKFKDFQNNIISLLKQEKRQKPSTIPYYFTILEQYPQFLVLYYLPKEKMISEYIKVKPRGFFFHEAYHTSLTYLTSWFKRHHSERSYQSQLSRIKPPIIDTTNHFAIKGRVERPMTPLYSAPNTPRREEPAEEINYGNSHAEEYDRRDDDRRERRGRRRSRGDRMDRGERRDDRKCKKCGLEGHLAKDCIKGNVSNCYNCGKEGHFAKECTERRTPKREKSWDDSPWRTPIETPDHSNY